MKKIIAWLLVVALTAAISIGATLAYLTDTDEDVNVMTLGNVKIDQLEYERIDDETANEKAEVQEFHDNKPLYPGVYETGFDFGTGDANVDWEQIGKDGYTSGIWNPEKINNELDKMVFVKNKGSYDAYVRTVFAFEAGNYTTLDEFQNMMHLNLNEDNFEWTWVETPVEIPNAEGSTTKYFVAVATYKDILKPGALTEISLSQIALDKTATNADVEAFGDTYQILVKSQGIQADGFDTAMLALDEGFGVINSASIPWQIDAPEQGVTVKNALHYLNGDNTSTAITSKISSVTFGLTKNYANIADNYDAVLVSEEQDVPVYAYYVPNNGQYDVYMLASDAIYAPKDSTGLFQGMTNVTAINTDNLDVSRVDQAVFMFRQCEKLPVLDTTGWDTSNITNMQGMFYKCYGLQEIIGVSDWDVSNVTSLYAAFYNLHAMTKLDLSGWNASKVTNLNMAIRSNNNLSYVDLSGWNISSACNASDMLAYNPKLVTVNATGMNTSGITDASCMFYEANALTTIIGSESLTFPNLVDAAGMFEKCQSLPSIDVTNWGLGKCELTSYMFNGCSALTEITGSGNLNLGSVKDATGMFQLCQSLQSIDVTNWGLGKCELTTFMFNCCSALTEIKGSNKLDLGSVKDASCMFQVCSSLPSLDATNWDLGNCTTMSRMFHSCESLVTVEGSETWNTGNVTDMYAAFYNNPRLVDLDVSTWNTSNVTTMEQMFRGNVDLLTLDVADWDVSKVTSFGGMFGSFNQNAGDMDLQSLDLRNWRPAAVTTTRHMFYGCGQLQTMDMTGWNTPKLEDMSHMFADCYKLEQVVFTGWNTPALVNMDAMFNNCEVMKSVDMSMFNTSNVLYFSQLFEACYALEEVIGLENWNTAKGDNFSEMFSGCGKLKELDLSSFDTRNADHLKEGDWVFLRFISGCTGLEKITFGPYFDFDGVGCADGYKFVMPAASKVAGWDGKWYTADGTGYLPSEIPELTAATYYAVNPLKPATPPVDSTNP